MPRGYYPRHPKPATVIEVDPAARTGWRGKLERLMRDFQMKAQALRVAGEILDADERQTAAQAAPQKFLQAFNHRGATSLPMKNKKQKRKKYVARQPRQVRLDAVVAFLTKHPGASTGELAKAVGIGATHVLKLAHEVAKPAESRRGDSRTPISWVLR